MNKTTVHMGYNPEYHAGSTKRHEKGSIQRRSHNTLRTHQWFMTQSIPKIFNKLLAQRQREGKPEASPKGLKKNYGRYISHERSISKYPPNEITRVGEANLVSSLAPELLLGMKINNDLVATISKMSRQHDPTDPLITHTFDKLVESYKKKLEAINTSWIKSSQKYLAVDGVSKDALSLFLQEKEHIAYLLGDCKQVKEHIAIIVSPKYVYSRNPCQQTSRFCEKSIMQLHGHLEIIISVEKNLKQADKLCQKLKEQPQFMKAESDMIGQLEKKKHYFEEEMPESFFLKIVVKLIDDIKQFYLQQKKAVQGIKYANELTEGKLIEDVEFTCKFLDELHRIVAKGKQLQQFIKQQVDLEGTLVHKKLKQNLDSKEKQVCQVLKSYEKKSLEIVENSFRNWVAKLSDLSVEKIKSDEISQQLKDMATLFYKFEDFFFQNQQKRLSIAQMNRENEIHIKKIKQLMGEIRRLPKIYSIDEPKGLSFLNKLLYDSSEYKNAANAIIESIRMQSKIVLEKKNTFRMKKQDAEIKQIRHVIAMSEQMIKIRQEADQVGIFSIRNASQTLQEYAEQFNFERYCEVLEKARLIMAKFNEWSRKKQLHYVIGPLKVYDPIFTDLKDLIKMVEIYEKTRVPSENYKLSIKQLQILFQDKIGSENFSKQAINLAEKIVFNMVYNSMNVEYIQMLNYPLAIEQIRSKEQLDTLLCIKTDLQGLLMNPIKQWSLGSKIQNTIRAINHVIEAYQIVRMVEVNEDGAYWIKPDNIHEAVEVNFDKYLHPKKDGIKGLTPIVKKVSKRCKRLQDILDKEEQLSDTHPTRKEQIKREVSRYLLIMSSLLKQLEEAKDNIEPAGIYSGLLAACIEYLNAMKFPYYKAVDSENKVLYICSIDNSSGENSVVGVKLGLLNLPKKLLEMKKTNDSSEEDNSATNCLGQKFSFANLQNIRKLSEKLDNLYFNFYKNEVDGVQISKFMSARDNQSMEGYLLEKLNSFIRNTFQRLGEEFIEVVSRGPHCEKAINKGKTMDWNSLRKILKRQNKSMITLMSASSRVLRVMVVLNSGQKWQESDQVKKHKFIQKYIEELFTEAQIEFKDVNEIVDMEAIYPKFKTQQILNETKHTASKESLTPKPQQLRKEIQTMRYLAIEYQDIMNPQQINIKPLLQKIWKQWCEGVPIRVSEHKKLQEDINLIQGYVQSHSLINNMYELKPQIKKLAQNLSIYRERLNLILNAKRTDYLKCIQELFEFFRVEDEEAISIQGKKIFQKSKAQNEELYQFTQKNEQQSNPRLVALSYFFNSALGLNKNSLMDTDVIDFIRSHWKVKHSQKSILKFWSQFIGLFDLELCAYMGEQGQIRLYSSERQVIQSIIADSMSGRIGQFEQQLHNLTAERLTEEINSQSSLGIKQYFIREGSSHLNKQNNRRYLEHFDEFATKYTDTKRRLSTQILAACSWEHLMGGSTAFLALVKQQIQRIRLLSVDRIFDEDFLQPNLCLHVISIRDKRDSMRKNIDRQLELLQVIGNRELYDYPITDKVLKKLKEVNCCMLKWYEEYLPVGQQEEVEFLCIQIKGRPFFHTKEKGALEALLRFKNPITANIALMHEAGFFREETETIGSLKINFIIFRVQEYLNNLKQLIDKQVMLKTVSNLMDNFNYTHFIKDSQDFISVGMQFIKRNNSAGYLTGIIRQIRECNQQLKLFGEQDSLFPSKNASECLQQLDSLTKKKQQQNGILAIMIRSIKNGDIRFDEFIWGNICQKFMAVFYDSQFYVIKSAKDSFITAYLKDIDVDHNLKLKGLRLPLLYQIVDINPRDTEIRLLSSNAEALIKQGVDVQLLNKQQDKNFGIKKIMGKPAQTYIIGAYSSCKTLLRLFSVPQLLEKGKLNIPLQLTANRIWNKLVFKVLRYKKDEELANYQYKQENIIKSELQSQQQFAKVYVGDQVFLSDLFASLENKGLP